VDEDVLAGKQAEHGSERTAGAMEENAVCREFRLLALSMKINDWLRAKWLAEFDLPCPNKSSNIG